MEEHRVRRLTLAAHAATAIRAPADDTELPAPSGPTGREGGLPEPSLPTVSDELLGTAHSLLSRTPEDKRDRTPIG
jgi:hypothetical protein